MPTTPSASKPGPPRLLLGAALLFWGGMADQPLIGLILAIVVEASHWTRIRWDFGEPAFYRAWQASVLLIFFGGALIWLNASNVSALPRTLIWLPALFLPLQFVQSYGIQRTMPLATFSLFVRKRREHAQKHGLPFRDVQISFSHVYFVIILIAASLGVHARNPIHFPACVILVAVAFGRQFSFHHRLAPLAAILALSLATIGGYGGAKLLDLLYQKMIGGLEGRLELTERQTSTSIGKLGEIKQTPQIIWRLRPLEGPLPKLIRIASYNTYFGTRWRAEVPPLEAGTRLPNDFEELGSIGVEEPYRIIGRDDADSFLSGEEASDSSLPRFILRGSLGRRDLLPIPSSATAVVIPAQELEINSLGTLRIEPVHPVANATTLWKPGQNTGVPPWVVDKNNGPETPDLKVPKAEQETIQRVATQLGLYEGGMDDKIRKLQAFFLEEFTYTRYLGNRYPDSKEFIRLFLEESKRGHCEYFATASALLLREAGIPTRYATGFAVVETHPRTGEALLRGTHAHAWCEAYDETRDRWINVDLTPPDWTGLESPRLPAWQGWLDRWQMLRDDLLVWRSEPGNLALALAIILVPLAVGALLIGRRLWRSRRRIDPTTGRRLASGDHPQTPLSALEKPATRVLGPRPAGTPLGHWLLGLGPRLSQPETVASLDQAIQLHRTLRFDPQADAEQLEGDLEKLVETLRPLLKRTPVT